MTEPVTTTRVRGRVVLILLVCAAVLVPWLIYLGITLDPGTVVVRRWAVAWVGLDVAEVVGLVMTAALVRRNDPRAAPAAAATGTLFLVDAWFDVVTARIGADYVESLTMAAVAEVPLAALCAAVVWRSSRWSEPEEDDHHQDADLDHCQPAAERIATQMNDHAASSEENLEEAIARGYEQRDRDHMEPTIRYFEDLLSRHPGHPVLTYELAGAHDTAGEESVARQGYEQALRLGLSGDARRRCLCQYGSTLRWLGDLQASLDVLEGARREFPDSVAVRVFYALTLNDAGRHDEAVAALLGVITDHAEATDLGRYAAGLSGLARWLGDGRPDE